MRIIFNTNIITKIVLTCILITFIIWGIGLEWMQKNVTWVLKVGNTTYDAKDFLHVINMTLSDPLAAEEAKKNPLWIKNKTIQELKNNALILEEANRMEFLVNDSMLKQEIINMKMFQNQDGNFDKKILQEILKKNNLPEDIFIDKFKQQIVRDQLLDMFYNIDTSTSMQLLDLISKMIFAKQELYLYEVDLLHDTIPIDDETLQNYFNNHIEQYRTPEQRIVQYVDFPEPKVSVSNDEIIAEYNKNIDNFTIPEKRKVLQVLIKNQTEAEKALQLLKQKKITFQELIKKYSNTQSVPSNLGIVDKSSFDPKMGEQIFALEKNQPSELIQSMIGSHIFLVTEIIKPKQKDLKLVKDELIHQIVKNKKIIELNKTLDKIREYTHIDIELIAKKYNLKLYTENITDSSISKIFKMEKNTQDIFIDNNQVKIIHILDIIPGEIPPLKAIQSNVEQNYINEMNQLHTLDHAQIVRKKVIDGEKIKYKTIYFNKFDQTILPNDIVKFIVQQQTNGLESGVSHVYKTDKGYNFISLGKISFDAYDKLSEEEKFQFLPQIQLLYKEIVFDSFIKYLEGKYKVQINHELINRIVY